MLWRRQLLEHKPACQPDRGPSAARYVQQHCLSNGSAVAMWASLECYCRSPASPESRSLGHSRWSPPSSYRTGLAARAWSRTKLVIGSSGDRAAALKAPKADSVHAHCQLDPQIRDFRRALPCRAMPRRYIHEYGHGSIKRHLPQRQQPCSLC
jgi:hypothetical protein